VDDVVPPSGVLVPLSPSKQAQQLRASPIRDLQIASSGRPSSGGPFIGQSINYASNGVAPFSQPVKRPQHLQATSRSISGNHNYGLGVYESVSVYYRSQHCVEQYSKYRYALEGGIGMFSEDASDDDEDGVFGLGTVCSRSIIITILQKTTTTTRLYRRTREAGVAGTTASGTRFDAEPGGWLPVPDGLRRRRPVRTREH
jgi:hypothetical protein